MRDAAEEVLSVLPLTAEDKKKYEAVKAFEKHYVEDVIFEGAQYRCQQDGENAKLFITAVHKFA